MCPEFIGGTYSYIYELGRRLAAKGHSIDMIVSTRTYEDGSVEDLDGIRVHRYTFRRVHPAYSTAQHLRNTYAAFQEIHSREPVDLIGIHDTHLGLKTATSALGRSICQIPTYHAPSFLEYRFDTERKLEAEPSPLRRAVTRMGALPLERMQWRFERGVLRAADGILVLSRYTRGHIERNFPDVDTGKVKIIPSGVDIERFSPAEDRASVRESLGFASDSIQLLSVRRLAPRMGLGNLIRAIALVRGGDAPGADRVNLTICGRGELMESLKSLASELGISEHVDLAGRVLDEDLDRHYKAADLFVLPTTDLEGFGISTVEALSANLPVVGTPAGATPEILGQIDERLLTEDTSSEAIAAAICRWLRWRDEDGGTTRYRDFAVENYAWDDVADRVEEYYSSEISSFRKRRDGDRLTGG